MDLLLIFHMGLLLLNYPSVGYLLVVVAAHAWSHAAAKTVTQNQNQHKH